MKNKILYIYEEKNFADMLKKICDISEFKMDIKEYKENIDNLDEYELIIIEILYEDLKGTELAEKIRKLNYNKKIIVFGTIDICNETHLKFEKYNAKYFIRNFGPVRFLDIIRDMVKYE